MTSIMSHCFGQGHELFLVHVNNVSNAFHEKPQIKEPFCFFGSAISFTVLRTYCSSFPTYGSQMITQLDLSQARRLSRWQCFCSLNRGISGILIVEYCIAMLFNNYRV